MVYNKAKAKADKDRRIKEAKLLRAKKKKQTLEGGLDEGKLSEPLVVLE